MQRTKIEWVKNQDGSQGYTSNPVKGLCPVDCKDNQGKSYCYARAMYKRFKWDETIRFVPEEMNQWAMAGYRSKIFVGSTIELFGEWVPDLWMEAILDSVRGYKSKTFLFLTKQPWNLPKWNPWPDNAWVGTSITNIQQAIAAVTPMAQVEASIKFISYEPLLEKVPCSHILGLVDWIIIGSQTGPGAKPPRLEWAQEIIGAADRASVPVFLKDNLLKIYPQLPKRREFPR